ncbi:hypothetical protein BJ878DRAFT_580904 [Calycina marina]|uniref:NACHT domain-containing protein n=1 Tax=Calycina marina TaxID=1763456 RepID=A0A9P7Z7R4_9HELO|nr:hypothetical protein BJ878DRAFT_580904 [Calycina marina]
MRRIVPNWFLPRADIQDDDKACLKDLRVADPGEDKKRIQDTEGGILKDSYTWALENSIFRQWQEGKTSQLLWIRGDPCKGKTMLLCGIIDNLEETANAAPAFSRCLMSYFFCQATDLRINNATAVLRGLIYLLADQKPALLQHLFVDKNAWYALSEIFTNILQDPSLERTCVVIDALDECLTGLQQLLQFIVKTSPTCPRVNIEEQLRLSSQQVQLRLELNQDSISAAGGRYIEHESEKSIREYLSLNADATFLWVALVLQELKMIDRRYALKKAKMIPPGLGPFYKQMMDQMNGTLHELNCPEDLSEDLNDLKQRVGQYGSFLTIRDNTVHYAIFSRSLQFISMALRRDIYSLKAPGITISQSSSPI